MRQVKIKALSINEAWQGRRYKTTKYTKFAEDLTIILLTKKKPPIPSGSFCVHYKFHVSNMQTDVDNLIKAFQDVLFRWLGIDDRRIRKLTAEKIKCKKGKEKIEWALE